MSSDAADRADEKSAHQVRSEEEDGSRESHLAGRQKTESWWHTVQRYIWDDPDKPADEKRFLLKLDFYLLTYTCLGYFCKNLDQGKTWIH